MRIIVPYLLEGLVMLGIYVLALALSSPIRSRHSHESKLPRGPVACLGNLLCSSLRPLLVLLLSPLVLLALQADPRVCAWLASRHSHLTAWWIFWSVLFVVDVLESFAVEVYALRGLAFPVPGLLRRIGRALIVVGLVLTILKVVLGVNISPLLASTALLTAVIGFALQGVLGNLMSGMSLHISRAVLPGDWVAIGEREGQVITANWRETRLRTHDGHVIVIPNTVAATEVIHNMSRPDPLRRQSLMVGASYSDAPGQVIAALEEAAREVAVVEAHPPPQALVRGYMDFGINYELRFWTRRYHDHVTTNGEVGRLIWYKFKRRGIEIPFPMSDKLLNDFMEVVYTQRRLESDEKAADRLVSDILKSDFGQKFLSDDKGACLVSAEEMAAVVPHVRRVPYAAGEVLFEQNSPGETCFIVADGVLRGQVVHEDGVPPVEFDLGPGSLVGEMSLITEAPRTATIIARRDCELIEISPAAFACLLSLREEVPAALATLVAQRLAENEAAYEVLKAAQSEGGAAELGRSGILKRLMRLVGRNA